MSIKELKDHFDVALDKINSNNMPEISPEEFDILINWGADNFIKQRYKNFEVTEKRIDDLRAIVKYSELVPVSSAVAQISSSQRFLLPEDYAYSVYDEIHLYYPHCGKIVNTVVQPTKAEHSRLMQYKRDPFNRPDKANVLKTIQGDYIYITKKFDTVITKYLLGYISWDFKIKFGTTWDFSNWNVVQYPFPDAAVNEIIDYAVLRTSEYIQSTRFSTFSNIFTIKE